MPSGSWCTNPPRVTGILSTALAVIMGAAGRPEERRSRPAVRARGGEGREREEGALPPLPPTTGAGGRRGAGAAGGEACAGGRPPRRGAAVGCPGRAALPPQLALEDKSGGKYLWGPPECPGRHCPYKDWGTGPGGHVGARVRDPPPRARPSPPPANRAPRGRPRPAPAPLGPRRAGSAPPPPRGVFRWRGPCPKKARIRPRPACPF